MLASFVSVSALVGCVPAMPPTARGAEVALHLDGDPGVRLEQLQRHVVGRRGESAVYTKVCVAPCDIVVHDWTRFRVSIDHDAGVGPFFLQPGAPVTLRVHRGKPRLAMAGGLAAFLAAPIALESGIFAVAAPETRPASPAISIASVGVVAFGVALLVAGRTTMDATPASAVLE